MENKIFITVAKAAKAVSVSNTTVLNHIKSGKLAARKRLSSYVIDLPDLKEWAASQGLTLDLTKL